VKTTDAATAAFLANPTGHEKMAPNLNSVQVFDNIFSLQKN
jgi:hypothetical protein